MMGKPKTGGGVKDGRHLLLEQGTGTESEVQEFPLPPPRRPSRMRSRKSGSHHSDHFCRDLLRIVIVLVVLAMMGGIGFLGFVYYKLNGEMEKLKTGYMKIQGEWSTKGPMAEKINGAAKSDDMTSLKNGFKTLNNKFQLIHQQLILVNSTVAHLSNDAKHWDVVLESTSQLQKVGSNVNALTEEVTKMVSNVKSIDRDLGDMKKSISVLKSGSSETKQKVAALHVELNSVKGDVQTCKSKVDELEHSHSVLQQRTSGLDMVNVTAMDADMHKIEAEISRLVSAVELLQATTNSGEHSAGLKPVVEKLEEIKQGVLNTNSRIESLKHRLTAVEKVEAQHQDDVDSLLSTVSNFNSSLTVLMMTGQQVTKSFVEDHMHNFTLQIEERVKEIFTSLRQMIKTMTGGQKGLNMSLLIDTTVRHMVVSMRDEIRKSSGIFLEGMNMLQANMHLQNETITNLKQEFERVSMLVWRLRAEITAEKSANKHVEPTDEKPKLPTETRNKTTSHATEMTNHTTTEAALDDVPVTAVEKLSDKPITGNPNPPLQGNTASSNDVVTTSAAEETEVVTIPPLTTKQTELTHHRSSSGQFATLMPEMTVQEKATSSSPLHSTSAKKEEEQAITPTSSVSAERNANMSYTSPPTEIAKDQSSVSTTEAAGPHYSPNSTIHVPDVINSTEHKVPNITNNDEESKVEQLLNTTEGIQPGQLDTSLNASTKMLDSQDSLETEISPSNQPASSAEDQNELNVTSLGKEAEMELSSLDNVDTPDDHNTTATANGEAAAQVPSEPSKDELLKDAITTILEMFHELDSNDDGALSHQELLNFVPKDMLDQLVATVDLNFDGKLSREEFEEASKEHQENDRFGNNRQNGDEGGP